MSTMRTPARLAALLAASALVLVGAPSWADESGSPAPSPEATTTSEGGTNPTFDAPETVDTYVGQSVQVRKNADGFQNSDYVNFRWTATQVNAESLNGLDVSVPLPMDDAPGLRSLTGRANMPTVVDGGVLYDFDNVNGVQTKRTLSLWPEDRPLPVDVSAEFTLNGEKVTADEIVGAGGLVTATYTIINQSIETQDVEFENVQGEPDTEEVETSQAFVGISKAFIPQSWAQFDAGNGIFGADGRGNYQTQWISLAFLPFAEDGKASFGWSAVIPEGEAYIPKMTIEVSPLYVPTHVSEEEEEGAAASNSVPRPNMDAATATVHSGVEELIAGIDSLAASVGKTKEEVKEGVSIAVSQVKAAIDELCSPELLYCDNPEVKPPLTESIQQLIGTLTALSSDLQATIDQINSGGVDPGETVDQLVKARDALVNDVLPELEDAQAAVESLNNSMNNWLGDNCGNPEVNPQDSATTQATTGMCTQVAEWVAQTGSIAGLLEIVKGALNDVVKALDAAIANIPEGIANIQVSTLTALKDKVDGVVGSLTDVQAFLAELAPPLADLNAGIDSIGAAIDSGLANLSGAGAALDQIASGKAQISAGLGAASEDVQNYLAEVVAVAQAAAESAQETAADVEAQANTIKAEMAGLLGRMAESPLPYSGGMNTVFAPAGDQQQVQDEATALVSETGPVEPTDTIQPTTELFGAYQFMLDPADRMRPTVPWRIGLAILLVIGGGLLGMRFAKKAAA